MNYCELLVQFPKAISSVDCDRITQLGLAQPADDVKVERPESSAFKIGRRTKLSWLRDDWIYELVNPFLLEANRRARWNFKLSITEPLQFTCYETGGGYGWHSDQAVRPYGPNERGKGYSGLVRKISFTLQLSDPTTYAGGDFEIANGVPVGEGRIHTASDARDRGTLIFFPSFRYHQVTEVTSGMRHSLVGWVCGPQFT
jgi:predicted 2-oxoglutarate/Fe(II)-dependent dioxygenase YbiX